MKLYQSKRAPNPRRTRIFMGEKNMDFDNIEIIELDLVAGENLSADYKQKNPMGGVPVLEFDDGTCISESVAISRYFEATIPEPPLMGRDALDQAKVEMWNRRMELGFLLPVSMAFRHTKGHFSDRETVVPEYGKVSYARAHSMFEFLNEHFANSEYTAGGTFTIADITTLCAVDFARVIDLRIGDHQPHLQRWYDTVSARPSARY